VSASAYSAEVRRRCRELPYAGGWPADPAVVTGTSVHDASETRIQMQLRVLGDRIEDARFRAFGCSAAIASASVVAESVVGLTLRDVRALDATGVARALDLADDKLEMASRAVDAARAAVAAWEDRAELGARVSGPGGDLVAIGEDA
jgi:NifU-like protein involved in Fe-S cluster formation